MTFLPVTGPMARSMKPAPLFSLGTVEVALERCKPKSSRDNTTHSSGAIRATL
jgi:hypothetical protein